MFNWIKKIWNNTKARCDRKLVKEIATFITFRCAIIAGAITFWVGTNLKEKFATLPYLPLTLATLHVLDAPLLFYQKNLEYKENRIRKLCAFPIFGAFKLCNIAYMGAIQAFLRENTELQYYGGISLGIINGMSGLIILGDSIFRNTKEFRENHNYRKLLKFIISSLIFGGNLVVMITNPICLALKASNLPLGIITVTMGTTSIGLLTADFFNDACNARAQRRISSYQRLATEETASPPLTASSSILFFSPNRVSIQPINSDEVMPTEEPEQPNLPSPNRL